VEERKRFSRLFYVENMFRFEEGEEPREIWQCGVELLGSDRSESLAELILLGKEVLSRLGFEIEVDLSHADLEVLKDKEFASLFGEGGRSHGFLANLASLPLPKEAVEGVDELKDIASLLDELEISYSIDLPWVENFEYYTGGIFKFSAQGKKVGGGGRYDHLIPLLEGGEVPACGFALYVDSLIDEMKVLPKDEKILVLGEDKRSCFEVADKLRDRGYTAVLDLGIPCVVEWEVEVRENLLRLVDRKTRKEISGSLDDIISGIENSFT
jgi:histidyl-tRNA synthetase